jgi:hypothetical protein
MGVRQSLEKKIEAKRSEVLELEAKLREAQAFLLGMQEVLKMLPRENIAGVVTQSLRPGSDMANTRDFLARIGRPAHISEIMEELNKDGSADRKRTSVSSSLASYARKGEIFKRTGPNVFSLIDLDLSAQESASDAYEEPPGDFGDVEAGDEEEVVELSANTADSDEIPF